MKSSLPDRRLVREYLLGRLDEEKDHESDLSEQVLHNNNLADMVESIEDEIIEEYLDGTLDPADRTSVEQYFLRPPERKEKLRFARLLRQHFETKQDDLLNPVVSTLPVRGDITGVVPRASWGHHFRTYGQFVALILLSIVSLTYISDIHKKQEQLERELAQEQERSATLAQATPPLAQATPSLRPSLIGLTLVRDRSRDDGTRRPHIEINSSTKQIMVEIALPGVTPGPYEVRLESNKGPLWSAKLLPLVSSTGDARLVFGLPAASFESGVSSFVVSSSPAQEGWPKHYDFAVTVKK